jgi:hypothetical protein
VLDKVLTMSRSFLKAITSLMPHVRDGNEQTSHSYARVRAVTRHELMHERLRRKHLRNL